MWLRRDLRLRDNVALARACEQSGHVCLVFVVDPGVLASPRMGAPIAAAFFSALSSLRAELRGLGSDLAVLCGKPHEEITAFARRTGAAAVFYNEDYEPDAIRRDERAQAFFTAHGLRTHAFLDHVYFGAGEIARASGAPYKIFTPYSRAWLARHHDCPRPPADSLHAARGKLAAREEVGETLPVPATEDFGFAGFPLPQISERTAQARLKRFANRSGLLRYARERDFPAADATSHLSVHLRAGTIGIRTCFEAAFAAGGSVWANELIWREFYQTILRRFPHVAEKPFLEKAEAIRWRRADADFAAWCEGRTGYPIVDAAMRQLNTTGWMHNRLRMITASFLTKHLLIDWRRGERYFEQHLIDADLAQNNGGWQWCASTGTDAAPYFRIFNPVLQSKKFDPQGAFIRAMLPELRGVPLKHLHAPWNAGPVSGYPAPIVDHAFARQRALEAYAGAF